MKQLLTLVTGGQLQKGPILAFAKRIAQAKQLKIHRGAKRIKDCFFCWFCEHSPDVLPFLLPDGEMPNKPAGIGLVKPVNDPLNSIFTPDDEITWMSESDPFR
jgi:hypothetical protein